MSDPEGFKPKVFVGLPFYGDAPVACILASQAVGVEGAVDICEMKGHSISSLVNCFNTLWVDALNARDRGEATHFAMIHADCQPEPGWVEKLWQAMKGRPQNPVVVSAVNCIKDQNNNPRTSTAYGKAGYPWGASRYVRYQDREEILEKFGPTFGPETCQDGEVLLINTGCMLIDLRHEFWDGFAWEQPAIVQRDEAGTWQTAFEPEDWRMSRFLAAKGVDYAATWAVRVIHHGHAQWPNY